MATRKKAPLTAQRLMELLHYEPTTGQFAWRTGRAAGSVHSAGYLEVRVDGNLYLCHRLAWLYVHGDWPAAQIDHINRTRTDNRIANLRECTNQLNCQNVRAHRDGSGLLGTSWEKRRGKWQAGIGINGKRIFLGYHSTREEAHAAYLQAKRELHPFGACNV